MLQEIMTPVPTALEPSTEEKGLRAEVNVPQGLARILDAELFRGLMMNIEFQRLRSARRSATQGTGLRLLITKTVVARRGGRIWAKSAPGKGVTFAMEVPPGSKDHAKSLSEGQGE